MKLRSFLYAPATHLRLIAKAEEVNADVAIIDLQDSVAPEKKGEARLCLLQHLETHTTVKRAVRINEVNAEDGLRDLLLLIDQSLHPELVIVPMAIVNHDIEFVYSILGQKNPQLQLLALIESVDSLLSLREIPSAPDYFKGVLFGSADFALSLDLDPYKADLLWVKQDIILHAKRLGLFAIDTPCLVLQDDTVIREECLQGKNLGFDGKQAVHPSHVSHINNIFMDELDPIYTFIEENPDKSAGTNRSGNLLIGPPMKKYLEKIRGKQKGG